MVEYFYNNTQRGFCESRIINQTLSLRFVGAEPLVFKPGMPFEAQVAVRYHDQVALTQQQLERSTLRVEVRATFEDGRVRNLPDIRVPSKVEGFSEFQDIDRLRHYGQPYGREAERDYGRYTHATKDSFQVLLVAQNSYFFTIPPFRTRSGH